MTFLNSASSMADAQTMDEARLLRGGHLLFLIGLPGRFKDTVRQWLACCDEIQADQEDPWFLLPWLYQRREGGTAAEYNHTTARLRTAQFLASRADGEEIYTAGLRRFATSLYESRRSPSQRFVLDASDRYYHVIADLQALFPEARFILAIGNPLLPLHDQLLDRFHGSLELLQRHDDIYRDLVDAPRAMAAAAEAADDRCFVLREGEFAAQGMPAQLLGQLTEWLGIGDSVEPGKWDFLCEAADHVTAAGLPPLPRPLIDGNYLHAAADYLATLGPATLQAAGYDERQLRRQLLAACVSPSVRTFVARLPEDMVKHLFGTPSSLALQCVDAWLEEHGDSCTLPSPAPPGSIRAQIADSFVWLGEQRFGDDNLDGAVTAFQTAIQISQDARAYSNLAVVLHQQGETEAALDLLFEANRNNPGDAAILANLCTLLCEAGKNAEAKMLAMNFLSVHPDNTEAMALFLSIG